MQHGTLNNLIKFGKLNFTFNETIHTACRGEKLTTIMINNTNYGMTGGQASATTLVGQITTTTPHGRQADQTGYPLRAAEIIAQCEGTAYCARVAVTDTKNIIKTKNAIRKAFEAQLSGKGFGFVEVLAGCPTNWHMSPIRCFQRCCFSGESLTMNTSVIISGFGGQGALFAGMLLCHTAIKENKHTTWIPAYGAEMRGGAVHCSVNISDEEIPSPVIDEADVVIALNNNSLVKFENKVKNLKLILYQLTHILLRQKVVYLIKKL